MDTADTYGLTSRPDTLHVLRVAPCAPTIATLRRVADDAPLEPAARAYAAGVCDGHEGTPYHHDPRALAYGSSVWGLERLAYRAGFRHGDPEGRPVAVVLTTHRRAQAADTVRRIGSVPRLVETWPAAERSPRADMVARLARVLRDGRRRAARVPRPCVAYFAAVLGHWAETAGPTRAQCPNVCGADDAHLDALGRARDDAADAAEAWAWYQVRETDHLEREQRHDYPCDALSCTGALITPDEYVARLEHGDAVAPDGRRAPCSLTD